ncbi:MAG: cupredoxin domain-containing protein [Candidatus Curtissbacteria bacterium]|nr:cupredoxin domain-containing protein [Candidatus Curtissbacteria bacterium]
MNIRKISLVGIALASALLLSACNSYNTTTTSSQSVPSISSATEDASAAVIIYTDSGFAPTTLNAKVGQKVVFKNNSGSAIQVNSAPHPVHNLYPELNIGAIAAGSTGSTSFAAAGTYKYHNHLNPSQNGTIVVE